MELVNPVVEGIVRAKQYYLRDDSRTRVVPLLMDRLGAEEGEVLGSGGKVLTLVNLGDVYMEIYLPAHDAVRARLGADARIVRSGLRRRSPASRSAVLTIAVDNLPSQAVAVAAGFTQVPGAVQRRERKGVPAGDGHLEARAHGVKPHSRPATAQGPMPLR